MFVAQWMSPTSPCWGLGPNTSHFMWCPRWQKIGTKYIWANLKKTWQVFPWLELGSYVRQWTSLLSVHKRLILFTTLSPQEHRNLNLGLVALHVIRFCPHKVDKVELDWGLNCTWIGLVFRPNVQDWSLQSPSNMIWPFKIYLSQKQPFMTQPRIEKEDIHSKSSM